jgi:hypothetical protein
MDILRWTRRAAFGGAVFFGFLACSSPPPSSNLNPDKSTEKDDEDDNDTKQSTTPTGDTTPVTPTTNMTLTAINPPSVGIGTAPQGLTVTLTGTNFVNGVRVSVAGLATPATFVDAQTIKVVIPADKLAVQGNVALAALSANDAKSNELSLAVGTAGAGGLISLSPTGSPVGVQSVVLNVTGSGFDASSIVVFNNSDVTTQVLSPTNLRAVVPGFLLRQTGQVNVAVRKAGVLSSPVPFNVGQTGGGFCEMSCQEVGLFPGQCASTGGGFGFDFFGFDLGSLFGSRVQCGFDGCIHEGCD